MSLIGMVRIKNTITHKLKPSKLFPPFYRAPITAWRVSGATVRALLEACNTFSFTVMRTLLSHNGFNLIAADVRIELTLEYEF